MAKVGCKELILENKVADEENRRNYLTEYILHAAPVLYETGCSNFEIYVNRFI